MKTTPKKNQKLSSTENTLRLRNMQNEEEELPLPQLNIDDDEESESELPIRGRPSKKLLLQQQQQRSQFEVKLEPELKTVTAAALATSVRSKAKRSLYKKGTPTSTQKPHNESYVMRLFERSLDLSKYSDKTPLYPICRAWMANQPRNPNVAVYNTDETAKNVKREDNGEDLLAKLRNGEIKELNQLPKARSTDMSQIPPLLPISDKEKEAAQEMLGANKSELLNANLLRWKKVRNHWLKHAQTYDQERYEIIDKIMDIVCKAGDN